jgi:hypothetical protein
MYKNLKSTNNKNIFIIQKILLNIKMEHLKLLVQMKEQ